MSGCNDKIRGIWAGRVGPGHGEVNIIVYVTIQTTGNAVDYGDLFLARSQLGACSDSHGGLS